MSPLLLNLFWVYTHSFVFVLLGFPTFVVIAGCCFPRRCSSPVGIWLHHAGHFGCNGRSRKAEREGEREREGIPLLKANTTGGEDLGRSSIYNHFAVFLSRAEHINPSNVGTLRVQVPNNHILSQSLYYNYYYRIIGYMDP